MAHFSGRFNQHLSLYCGSLRPKFKTRPGYWFLRAWPNMIRPENMQSVASAASGALAPHGRGSRGPLRGLAGSRGQRPRKLTHFEHFKAILDAFPGSTGALQASTQRGNCFMFTLTCFTIN